MRQKERDQRGSGPRRFRQKKSSGTTDSRKDLVDHHAAVDGDQLPPVVMAVVELLPFDAEGMQQRGMQIIWMGRPLDCRINKRIGGAENPSSLYTAPGPPHLVAPGGVGPAPAG